MIFLKNLLFLLLTPFCMFVSQSALSLESSERFLSSQAELNGSNCETNLESLVLPSGGIHIFIHACTIGHWHEILESQLDRIYQSGLYDACSSISIGVLGTQNVSYFLNKYPKVKLLFRIYQREVFERPTLSKLHSFCKLHPDAFVLYLHTKGVTRGAGNPYITDWRRYMEYFAIDCWRDCIEVLQDFDSCGVNWRIEPQPHFNGNFWWARGDYASTLPAKIGPGYNDPEFWIGLNQPRIYNFHESYVQHYDTLYPEEKYKQ